MIVLDLDKEDAQIQYIKQTDSLWNVASLLEVTMYVEDIPVLDSESFLTWEGAPWQVLSYRVLTSSKGSYQLIMLCSVPGITNKVNSIIRSGSDLANYFFGLTEDSDDLKLPLPFKGESYSQFISAQRYYSLLFNKEKLDSAVCLFLGYRGTLCCTYKSMVDKPVEYVLSSGQRQSQIQAVFNPDYYGYTHTQITQEPPYKEFLSSLFCNPFDVLGYQPVDVGRAYLIKTNQEDMTSIPVICTQQILTLDSQNKDNPPLKQTFHVLRGTDGKYL